MSQEKNKEEKKEKLEVTLNLQDSKMEKKIDIPLDEFLLDWNSKLKTPYEKTLIGEITKRMNNQGVRTLEDLQTYTDEDLLKKHMENPVIASKVFNQLKEGIFKF